MLVSGDRPPWSARSDWYEMQHPPGGCGNFDNCTKTGGSYFATTDDETSHGLEPRPLPGQTLRIHYKPHKLSPTSIMKGAVRVHRDRDGTTKVVEARTKAYAPFTMPRFAGHIETYELGPAREATRPPASSRSAPSRSRIVNERVLNQIFTITRSFRPSLTMGAPGRTAG